MKAFSLLMIILHLSCADAARAYAESPTMTEVQLSLAPETDPNKDPTLVPEQLKIMGKGIRNHSGQTLAVACVGKNETSSEATCDHLRVVEFDQNNIPTWVSSSFTVTAAQNFKKELKKEYDDQYAVKYVHWKAHAKVKKETVTKFMFFGGTGALWGGYKLGLFIGVANLPVFLACLAGALLLMTIVYIAMKHPEFESAIVNGLANGLFVFPARLITNGLIAPIRGAQNALISDATFSMTASNGWNWAENPKKISDRKYEKMKSVLQQLSATKPIPEKTQPMEQATDEAIKKATP
jgi:hypothetical protein